MKKIISLLALVYMLTGLVNAEPVGQSSLNPFRDTSLLGVNQEDIYTVTVSTLEAKNVLPSRETRKAYTINNLDGANSVYKATYPATSSDLTSYQNYSSTTPSAGLIEISGRRDKDIQPYTGDIYIIGVDSTTQIEIIEKY